MFFEQTQIFQEGLSNRHVFFSVFSFIMEGLSVRKTDLIISSNNSNLFTQKPLFSPGTHTNFQEPLFSHRTYRYQFSRNLYFFIEQNSFSRKPSYLVPKHMLFSRILLGCHQKYFLLPVILA